MSDTLTLTELNGAQKCAVVCLALGPERAEAILTQLNARQVEAVVREVAKLGEVDAETVQAVLEEYQTHPGPGELTVVGGESAVHELFGRSLGDSGLGDILARVQAPEGENRLAQLGAMEPKLFAGLLLEELPQTAALILANLDPKQSAAILEAMPPETVSDIVYRMAQMDKIHPDMLLLLERRLESRTDGSLSQEMATAGDPAKVAKLLNMTSGGRDEEILQAIQQRNEVLAARIKALMFTFEDLLLVNGKGIQQILRDVDGKDLALALKGASAEVREHITSNMSSRAASALEEEVELLGAVRVSDVEEAQQRIMEGVRELEEAGEIIVQREGGSDEFIS